MNPVLFPHLEGNWLGRGLESPGGFNLPGPGWWRLRLSRSLACATVPLGREVWEHLDDSLCQARTSCTRLCRCAGSLSKELTETDYLFIYLFILARCYHRPKTTEATFYTKIYKWWDRWGMNWTVPCFLWIPRIYVGEDCSSRLLGDRPWPGSASEKSWGLFFYLRDGRDILFFFNKSHQDVVFHIFFDLAPGKPKLRLLGLPLRHIALYWNPNLLCSGPWPRSKATLLVN